MSDNSKFLNALDNNQKNNKPNQNKFLNALSEQNELSDLKSSTSVSGSLVEGVNIDEYDDYFSQGNVFINNDLDQARARNQSVTEQATNAGVKALGKAATGVVSNVGALGEIDMLWNPNKVIENSLMEAAEEANTTLDEWFPIYQTNPGKALDFGDSGWWFENLSNTASSAGSFALTGLGTGSLITKGLSLAINSTKAINAIGGLTNAVLLNHLEGAQEAYQVGQKTKQYWLDKGASEQEANMKAAEASATTYNIDRANLLLNLSSAGYFINPAKSGKDLIRQWSKSMTGKRLLGEGVQEYAEESINHVASVLGEKTGRGEDFDFKEGLSIAFKELQTPEAIEAGFLGFLGGVGQTGLAIGSKYVPQLGTKVQTDEGVSWKSQAQINQKRVAAKVEAEAELDQMNGAPNLKKVTDVFNSFKEQVELQNNLKNSDSIENTLSLLDKTLVKQTMNSLEGGTVDKLKEVYSGFSKLSEQEAKEKGLDTSGGILDYRERSRDAVETIDKLEKEYHNSQKFINSNEVFLNRANDLEYKKLKKLIQDKESVLMTEVTQEISDLIDLDPSVITYKTKDGVKQTLPYDVSNLEKTPEGLPPEGLKKYEEFINQIMESTSYDEYLETKRTKKELTLGIVQNNKEFKKTTSKEGQRKAQTDLKNQQADEEKQRKKYQEQARKAEAEANKKEREFEQEIKTQKAKEEPLVDDGLSFFDDIPIAESTGDSPISTLDGELQNIANKKLLSEPLTKEEAAVYKDNKSEIDAAIAKINGAEPVSKNNTEVISPQNKNLDVEIESSQITENDGIEEYNEEAIEDKYDSVVLSLTEDYVKQDGELVNTGAIENNLVIQDYNSINVNTELTIVVEENFGGNVYVKAFNDRGTSTESVSWNSIKQTLPLNERKAKTPIAVYAGDQRVGFIADNSFLVGDHKRENLNLREYLYDVKELKTKVVKRYNGPFNFGEKTNLLQSHPELNLGVIKNGEVLVSKDNDKDSTFKEGLTIKQRTRKEGSLVALVPTDKNVFEPLYVNTNPLGNTDEGRKIIKSLVNAVKVYVDSEVGSGVMVSNLDITTPMDLEKYFNQFIHTIKQGDIEAAMNKPLEGFANRFIQFKGNSINFGVQGESVLFINPKAPSTLNKSLDIFEKFLESVYIHGKLSNLKELVKLEILGDEGIELLYEGEYNDFLKNHISTNLKANEVNGTKTYTINDSLIFDNSFLSKSLTPSDQKPSQQQIDEINEAVDSIMEDEDFSVNTESSIINKQINYNLKSIKILQSTKAKQVFEKGKKNNWDLNKILTELQIPKEQKQIILDKYKGKVSEQEFIKSVFPDTKVKQVVYHGTKSKDKFNKFKTSDKKFKNGDNRIGFYFTREQGYAKEFGNTFPVILNIKNPKQSKEEINFGVVRKYQNSNDAVIGIDDASTILIGEEIESIAVFEPKQIHILTEEEQAKIYNEDNLREEIITSLLAENGYNPVEITDEYSNKWNEIILSEKQQAQIDLSVDTTASSIINKQLIKGLTANQQGAIVSSMLYSINERVVEDQLGNFGEISEEYKNFYENIKIGLESKGAQDKANKIQNVINGWSIIEEQVFNKLKSLDTLIIKEGQEDTELIEKNYEQSSIEVDQRKTLSRQLKRLFTSFQDLDENFKPKKVMGLTKIMPFDEVYNTLMAITVGTEPDIDLMLNQIKNHIEAKPYLKSVVDNLYNANMQTKNQFASAMNNHYVDSVGVQWSKRDDGSYVMTTYDSNQNSISKKLIQGWENDIQNSPFIKVEGDELIVSDSIKEIKNKLKSFKNTEDLLSLKNFLKTDLGIDLPISVLDYISKNKIKVGSNYISWSGQVESAGLFGSLVNELEKNIDQPLVNVNIVNNSGLKALATVTSKFRESVFANVFKDGENKTIFAFSKNKFTFNRFRDLLANKNNLLGDLSKMAFTTNSFWGEQLYNSLTDTVKDSVQRRSLKLRYIDTLKEFKSSRGVKIKNMSIAEQELLRFSLFSNRGQQTEEQRIGNLVFPTTSDKPNALAIQSVLYKTRFKSGELTDQTYNDIIKYVVFPEVDRMEDSRLNNLSIKGFKTDLFYFIPQLNQLLGDDFIVGNIKKVGSNEHSQVKEIVKNVIQEEVTAKLALWGDLGIGVRNEQGRLTYIDKGYVNYVKSLTDETNVLKFAVNDFIVNTMIGNVNMFQMLIGDPALFYKSKSDDSFTAVEESWDNIIKRLAGDVAPGTELAEFGSPVYKQGFIQDQEIPSLSIAYLKKILGKDGAKDYNKIEGTDAQEFTTLKEHIEVMWREGKLSEEVYNSIMDKISKNQLSSTEYTLSKKELNEVLQPVKPVYNGNHIEYSEGGEPLTERRVYVKSSSFPLIPQLTKGLEIDKLRTTMEKDKISRVAYSTATKVGAPKGMSQIFNKDGTIKEVVFNKNNTLTMQRANFRIQQEVPYKEKGEVNDGTQQRKLLFSNILNIGGFNYNGGSYKGSELQEIYNDKYNKLYESKFNQVVKDFGIDPETMTITKEGFPKFQKILLDEAISRGYTLNDIKSLEINDSKIGFKIPLWMTSGADKFESLLLSLIDNKIRKIKMKGSSYVLGSEDGFKAFENLTDLEKNKITWTDSYNPTKGLSIGQYGEADQVIAPMKMKDSEGNIIDISKYVNDQGQLDTSKFPKELLTMFAYRIPTQGLNSMSKIEVVGFLPEEFGDLMIAPREWTIQMGSDFDIDKIYVHHYEVEANELITKKESLENDILDIHVSVLSNPSKEVQAQIRKPLDFGQLPRLAKMIKEIKLSKNPSLFNPTGPTYQRDSYINNLAGKAGVGVFSLDSTLNASMENKDVVIGSTEYTKEGAIFTPMTLSINGKQSNGDLSNNLTLNKNRTKSDVIAAYQSAAVDNAKEKLLDILNINTETFGVIRILNALGYNEEDVITLITQDAIVEYVEASRNLKSSLGEASYNVENQAFEKIYNKFYNRLNESEKAKVDNADVNFRKVAEELSVDDKRDELEKSTPLNQIALLKQFMSLIDRGKQLQGIQSTINSDSSGIGKNLFETDYKMKKIINLKSNPNFSNIESLIGEYEEILTPKTIAGFAAVYGVNTANKIYREFFNYNKAGFNQALRTIQSYETEEIITSEDQSRQAKRVFNSLKAFLYAKVVDDSNTERERIFYGDKSLAHKVRAFKETKRGRENAFVRGLETKVYKEGSPNTVNFISSISENIDEADYYLGFLDLINKVDEVSPEYNTLDLAMDLIKYSFLSGNFNGVGAFGKYIDVELLSDLGYLDKLNSFNFNDSSSLLEEYSDQDSNFVDQYFQHNSNFLPFYKMSDAQDKTGNFFFLIEDKNTKRKKRLYKKVDAQIIELPILGTSTYKEYNSGSRLVNDSDGKLVYGKDASTSIAINEKPQIKDEYFISNDFSVSNVSNSLSSIIDLSDNKGFQEISKAYLKLIDKHDIVMKSVPSININEGPYKGMKANGRRKRVGSQEQVFISDKASSSRSLYEETILHELTHALTSEKILNLSATQELRLNSLLKDTLKAVIKNKEHLDPELRKFLYDRGALERMSTGDLSAIKEFTAYAMSVPEFQKFLNDNKVSGNSSLMEKFINIVKDLLKSLGVNPSSILEGVVEEVVMLASEPTMNVDHSLDDSISNEQFKKIFNLC